MAQPAHLSSLHRSPPHPGSVFQLFLARFPAHFVGFKISWIESAGLNTEREGIEVLLGSLGFSTMWKVRSQHHGQVDPCASHGSLPNLPRLAVDVLREIADGPREIAQE